MFANTIDLTYNGATVTLNRVVQDRNGSEYYKSNGTTRHTLKISHTIPSNGSFGESHMVRHDVQHLDATTGDVLRTASSWFVMKTFDGLQDDDAIEDAANALAVFLSTANVTKLVDREN